MNYQPAPIDTTGVKLSPALRRLTERLARNTHDLWAQQRIKDGWRPGARRDDQRKLHPCLVPYAKLPEREKAYDRIAVLGVLKATAALGYRIEPPKQKSKRITEKP